MSAKTLLAPVGSSYPLGDPSVADSLPESVAVSSPGGQRASRRAVETLAERALAGQPDVVTELLDTVRPMVMRYCRGRLGRKSGRYELADDVAQETCLAIVTALPRFREQGRPFLAFVYGIAAHKVADAQRREMRTPLPLEELPDTTDDSPGPEESVVRHLQARQARDLLERLPRHQREILLLRVVGGMSAGEAGEVLGMTSNNVRVQQHRALNRLRATLSPDNITR